MSTSAHVPRPGDVDPGAAPRDFEVRYYAELLWRRRILLAATAIGGLALGILGGELQVPRYQARTQLQVMPPNPTSLTVTDALVQTGNPMRDRQFFNTQLNVLHSRAIAERVVERLKLKDQPAFQGGGRPGGHPPRRGERRAGARDLRGRGEGHPQRPQGRGAVGQHAVRRLHGLQPRGPGRGGQARLQVGHRAAGRDGDRDAGGAGQAPEDLPGAGPLRARGQRLRDHDLDHQAQRGPHPGPGPEDRARGAAGRVRGGAPARAGPRRDPPGRRRRDGLGDHREDPVPDRGPRSPAREVQGGPPGGPEDPGPDAAAAQGPGRPGRADRGGPARGVPPAPAQGSRAQVGDRRPQGQGRRAEPEADRARVAQEEGGRRGRALRGAAAEAERDEHRRLAPEQQHPPARPRGGAGQPRVASQAPDRSRGAARRSCCWGRAGCCCATRSTTR